MEKLNSDYSVDVKDIARVVAINFSETSPPRSIFESTEITGKTFTEELIDHIVRKIPKN